MFVCLLSLGLVSCNSDDDDPRDPDGAIVLNVTGSNWADMTIETGNASEYAPKQVAGHFYWGTPDDLLTGTSPHVPDAPKVGDFYYHFSCDMELCSVGEVSGLGAIKRVPSGPWVKRLACEEDNGYVIRLSYHTANKNRAGDESPTEVTPGDYDYVEGYAYARFYVEDDVDKNGEKIGAKIKIQYPFVVR